MIEAGGDGVDVLIVGSGFGGSITAARLARPGRKVLVLEEGRRWSGEPPAESVSSPPDDASARSARSSTFRQSLDIRYFMELYRGHGDMFDRTRTPRHILREMMRRDRSGDVIIMRGCGVGGGSLIYSNIHLRAPSLVFDLAEEGGRRLWPSSVSRPDLDPYYARVEEMLHVRQLAWSEVSLRARVLAEGLRRIGGRLDPIRVALRDCVNCGYCSVGCRFDRKQSLYLNYIPLAEERGAVFRPGCKVVSIAPAAEGGWIATYRDAGEGRTRELRARTLVLAAGPVATPVLLLRSRAAMGGLSPHVGAHLSLTADAGFGAVVPQRVDGYRGKIISTICYSYLKSDGFVFEDLHYLPLASAVSFPIREDAPPAPDRPRYWGLENKRLLKSYGSNILSVGVMGIDRNEGRVTLDFDGQARLSFEISRHTQGVLDAAKRVFHEVVKVLDGTLLIDKFTEEGGLVTVHPLSTCRMSERAEDGVVAPDGSVWGQKGLFVIDGSIVPTSVAVNPSHTIAAIAERLSEGLAARLDASAPSA